MSREVVTRSKCDRCGATFEESPGQDEEKSTAKLYLEAEHFGHPKVKFEDVCPKCDDRIRNLLNQLTLTKDGNDEANMEPQTGNGSSDEPATTEPDKKKNKTKGRADTPATPTDR